MKNSAIVKIIINKDSKISRSANIRDKGSRDGNLNPTRGYPARPNPNGPDFTQLDKE